MVDRLTPETHPARAITEVILASNAEHILTIVADEPPQIDLELIPLVAKSLKTIGTD